MPLDFLHEFMLATARTDPGRPAVVESTPDGQPRTVSYGELQARVREYAEVLTGLGLDVGDRVLLESDTSACAVAALLACSMAGLTFIPVSPETPDRRLQAIVDTARPALHLQALDGRRDDVLPEQVGRALFSPAGLAVEHAPAPRTRRRRAAATTDAAYMIFTSGTTGRPKGVVMSHRGVLAFYRGMLRKNIVGPGDRVASTSPLQFDFALLDIGLALGSGATLIPVERAMVTWPRRLLRYLAETGATQVNGVPSMWRPALRHEPELVAGLHRVRGVLFSGEPFPLPELFRLQQLLPEVRVVNCFGPTEAMAFSLTDVPSPLPPDVERLSIGRAYDGAEMMLVDEDGRVVDEPGRTGEIHMRGPSLFTGYWDDPEGTAAALVPDPLDPASGQRVYRSGDLAFRGEDGELYFCGRIDSQVKIRGNRVELGEVERRITEYPGVAAAVALVVPKGDADAVLGVCLVMEPDVPPLQEARLSAFCKETLPPYMVPRELRVLEEFPVTRNGKTDRGALRELLH
ncbi:amino acid adenylation domain-containing protein [Streptomyces sp. NPDC019531]|uniref:amino acid adenylation domain-containing protein n=1 Tax=Streptomyces sp. NPDC019531 TaxID=3365062 RepID=UPI003850C45B